MSFIERYEDQLLTAATTKQREHTARRRRWRMPVIGFGGLATVGVAAAAFLLIPTGGGLSPVEEARAALNGPAQILHYRLTNSVEAVDGSVPKQDCDFGEYEVWAATSGVQRSRTYTPGPVGPECGPIVDLADGTPTIDGYEQAYEAGVETSYVPALRRGVKVTIDPKDAPRILSLEPDAVNARREDPQRQDPQAGLRKLLSAPGLRDAGVSRENGRLVRKFVIPETKVADDDPKRPKDGTIAYVVDAETFAPVSVTRITAVATYPQGGASRGAEPEYLQQRWEVRFPLWERLPLDAEHEGLLKVQAPVDATFVSGTAADFYQAPRSVQVKRAKEGKKLMKAYLEGKARGGTTP